MDKPKTKVEFRGHDLQTYSTNNDENDPSPHQM